MRTRWDERSTPSTWSALVRSRSGSAPEGRATSTGGGRTTRASRSPSRCWVAARAARPTSGIGPTSSAGPASEARSPKSAAPGAGSLGPVSAEQGWRPAPGLVLLASWWVIVMTRPGRGGSTPSSWWAQGRSPISSGCGGSRPSIWWRKSDPGFPEPVAVLGARTGRPAYIWYWPDVQAWFTRRGGVGGG